MATATVCSTRPLLTKLGIKPKYKILILHAPENYLDYLGQLPEDITLCKAFRVDLDFIHYFAQEMQALEKDFAKLKKYLAQNGMLWISWPKQSSGIKTDLNENKIREIGLKHGLVDVKVCAIDTVWSGLKFVYRLKNRNIL